MPSISQISITISNLSCSPHKKIESSLTITAKCEEFSQELILIYPVLETVFHVYFTHLHKPSTLHLNLRSVSPLSNSLSAHVYIFILTCTNFPSPTRFLFLLFFLSSVVLRTIPGNGLSSSLKNHFFLETLKRYHVPA